MTWRLMLHGGARAIPDADARGNLEGARRALAAAEPILARGGGAIDAVEAAVRQLEDDPIFNAGRGSVRNREGEIELDAAIMDGSTLALGAVAALQDVRHPVAVARALLNERATFLVGHGARRFADEIGAEKALPAPTRRASACDTVGCIASDQHGRFAAAISTGGLENVRAGRVGDAPLPGCGFYADDQAGAVCFSGDGEEIMRMMLAARAMSDLEHGASAQEAADRAIIRLRRVGGEAGALVIDRNGDMGWAHSSRHFTVGMQGADMPAFVSIQRESAPA